MNAFLIVLEDSIRLLRARRLFWISFGFSALAAFVYLSIGFDDSGMTMMFGAYHFRMEAATKGSPGAALLYAEIFSNYIVGIWLTWGATILALISCAPIFPEFMTEGAAGVTLSKPVSRPLLFLYKFIGGLMFVFFQTALFAVIVFIAIRWRIGYWQWSVFWSVPIVTLVFSYLFAIQTWIGVVTRSVMFSILGTIGIWLVMFTLNAFQGYAYQLGVVGRNPLTMERLPKEDVDSWAKYDTMLERVRIALPKTSETSQLMDRLIVIKGGGSILDERKQEGGVKEDASRYAGRNSIAYIILTSLGAEAVMLAFAARSFTRRDF